MKVAGIGAVLTSTRQLLRPDHCGCGWARLWQAVAAAAVDMFKGKSVRNIEKLIASMRGEEPQSMIKEMQFVTDKTYHFMTVVPNKPNAMAILITSKNANMGMGWASLRKSLPDIEPYCP